VCRLWWQAGHQRVWRSIQLRDSLGYVKDLTRRKHFASLVETITFQPGDNTLANGQKTIQFLDFKRLIAVNSHGSNYDGVRLENVKSLIVSSLRSWVVEESDVRRRSDHGTDDITVMSALSTKAASLHTLDIDMNCDDSLGPVIYEMLDNLSALEHLDMRSIGEILHQTYPPDVFLQKVLTNKPSLTTVSFTHGVDFSAGDVNGFLARMDRNWSIPSLRSFGRPCFNSVSAATGLIARMPNVEELIFTVIDRTGNFGTNVNNLFTFMSTVRQLTSIDLELEGDDCGFDGSWLVQLGALEALGTFAVSLYRPEVVTITGAQLAGFLVSSQKLKYLTLDLGTVVVHCSVEEQVAIQNAIGRIQEVDFGGITLAIQHTI